MLHKKEPDEACGWETLAWFTFSLWLYWVAFSKETFPVWIRRQVDNITLFSEAHAHKAFLESQWPQQNFLLENDTNELFSDQTVSAKLSQIWFSIYILTAVDSRISSSAVSDLDLDAKQRQGTKTFSSYLNFNVSAGQAPIEMAVPNDLKIFLCICQAYPFSSRSLFLYLISKLPWKQDFSSIHLLSKVIVSISVSASFLDIDMKEWFIYD